MDLDAEPIPFEDNYFDLVFCCDIIEHTLYPENLLKEMRRVLKEKGDLIAVVPNIASWLNRILILLGFFPIFVESTGTLELRDVIFHWHTGYRHAYTKESIGKLLEIIRFKVQRCLGAHMNLSPMIEQCVNLRDELMGDNYRCPIFIIKFLDAVGRCFALRPSFATLIIVKAEKV